MPRSPRGILEIPKAEVKEMPPAAECTRMYENISMISGCLSNVSFNVINTPVEILYCGFFLL